MRAGQAWPSVVATATAAATASATGALAHGTAERYDLPLPLGYYVVGAALAVALSFVVSAVFVYVEARPQLAPPPALTGWVLPTSLSMALRAFGLGILALVVVAGLFGNQHPARNIAPGLVWVAWWVWLSLLVALLADVWALLNPWRTLGLGWQSRYGVPCEPPRQAYPSGLSEWPAVATLLVFVWFELVSPFGSSPRALAILALTYTGWTLLAMRRFGTEVWLARGEVFTIVFRLLGRSAPIAIAVDVRASATAQGNAGDGGTLISLRRPGGALTEPDVCSNATVALLLLLLSAVLFDGLLGTALWRAVDRLMPFDRDGLIAATLGLLATWLGFLGIYIAACRIMRGLPGAGATTATLARRYAPTLVPIAVGYNVAHNFSYLLVQGQALLALVSDPLGWGWNLFGTALLEPNVGIVGARTTWLVAIFAIVGGHVASVVLAHVIGVSSEGSRQRALMRLLPLTIVMILYTAASLSIIADPMVRFRAPDPGYS